MVRGRGCCDYYHHPPSHTLTQHVSSGDIDPTEAFDVRKCEYYFNGNKSHVESRKFHEKKQMTGTFGRIWKVRSRVWKDKPPPPIKKAKNLTHHIQEHH